MFDPQIFRWIGRMEEVINSAPIYKKSVPKEVRLLKEGGVIENPIQSNPSFQGLQEGGASKMPWETRFSKNKYKEKKGLFQTLKICKN